MIISRTYQTAEVRLKDLKSFGFVVRAAFAAGVTVAWRQLSGVCEILKDRFNMRERTATM